MTRIWYDKNKDQIRLEEITKYQIEEIIEYAQT